MITTKLTFNRQYFYLTILRFLVEVAIAVYSGFHFAYGKMKTQNS